MFSFYNPRAKDSNINLFPYRDLSDRQSIIITDKQRVIQVLNNLLSNAFLSASAIFKKLLGLSCVKQFNKVKSSKVPIKDLILSSVFFLSSSFIFIYSNIKIARMI